MNQVDLTRLRRAITGQNPENPRTRVVDVETTAAQRDPDNGSLALRLKVSRGAGISQTFSIVNGTGLRKFIWNVPGFGFDAAVWS